MKSHLLCYCVSHITEELKKHDICDGDDGNVVVVVKGCSNHVELIVTALQ